MHLNTKGRWVKGPYHYLTTRRWRRINKRALQAAREFLAGNKDVLGGALKP
jgi:hypothetical protein